MYLSAVVVIPLACLLVLTPAITSAQSSVCHYEHCLEVNNSNNSGPGSLFEALVMAHRYNSSVEIQLSNGTFNLTNNIRATFQEWNEFSLTGQGAKITTINCESKDVGLVFNASRNLVFRSLSIRGCGREFVTTSVNLTHSEGADQVTFLRSKTGMYFNSCSNLTFEDFRIYGCYGSGITIYNTDGNNVFRHCDIIKNLLDVDDQVPGGGGVIIETSHCAPGNSDCQDNSSTVEETRGSSYLFQHCYFASNNATSHVGVFSASFPHGRAHMDLGKGGGLAVTLKGRAYGNQVVIESCEFSYNRAEWGGGLHLSFGDTSVNNSVVVSDSLFQGNNFDILGVNVGGGVRIDMVSFPPDQELWGDYINDVTGNSISFIDDRFLGNFASWGGAVSFVTTRNVPGKKLPNSLLFRSCIFMQNEANIVSSAVDISSWKPDVINSQEQYLTPVFEDCNFYFNSLMFLNITSYPVGLGALYIQGIPTEFYGTNTFFGNADTALVVSNTYISVMDSSVMNFTRNTGRRGGALAFIGNSWMIVHEDTYILFDGNVVGAYGLGGAVYSVHFGEHDLYFRQDCFFQYHKFNEPPARWNTSFVFKNNTADNHFNSIYTTSLWPCVWSNLGSWDDVPAANAFCDNSTWIFEGHGRDCHNEISTGPSRIEVTKINIDVIPGWNTSLGVQTYDDFNRSLPTVLVASPSIGSFTIANRTSYISDNNVVIYGVENTSFNNLLLMTPDPRVVASTVRIHVQNCPVGFRAVSCTNKYSIGQTCDCICNNASGVSCNDATKKAYLYRFNCVTRSNDNGSLLVMARCPYNQHVKLLLNDVPSSNLSTQVCKNTNRKGYLCSKCKEGFGVSVNNYDYACVPCGKRVKYNWALFLLIELGPITLVCFLVVLFGVSLVSPSMNAFVFFSQIVSIKYYHNSNCWFFGVDYVDPSLSSPIVFIYGIWNLDFFREVIHGICLHESLNTLHVLVINYVKAFYPMVVLMVCFIFIKLYDRHIRILHFLWKPFRYCLKVVYRNHKPSTSIIDAFTTLIVLSYTKVLYVTFPLVTLVTVHKTWADGNITDLNYNYYFHPSASLGSDLIYFLLGIVALIVFVGFPPIFLILYSFHFVQCCIGRLHPRFRIALGTFADSFLGAFRDGTNGGLDCRWFGGAYLLFRVVIFSIYIGQVDWINQYVIQQILCTLAIFLFAIARPYKIDFYNFLDVAFFTLLAILNSMSFYNSQMLARFQRVEKRVFYTNYVLMFLPMLYLVFLLVYRILVWRGLIKQFTVFKRTRERVRKEVDSEEKERPYDSEIQLPFAESEELPDRLVRPHLYSSLSPLSTLDVKERRSSQKAKTENSHLLPAGEAPYGSVPKKQERFTVPLVGSLPPPTQ